MGTRDAAHPAVRRVRFGVFEADLETGELRRNGLKIKLQEQAFQVLKMLLEGPGDLVRREALRERVWPGVVFTDFEHGLNKAVHKVRQALGDSADNPRFVETLARRGYRFIAPVDHGERPSATGREPRSTRNVFRVVWDGRAIPLGEGPNTIGRDEGSTIWVDSSTVSRHHARILVSEGSAVLEDLGSKNGTSVGGQRVVSSRPLADGDEIGVGSARMVFRTSRAGASTQTDTTRR